MSDYLKKRFDSPIPHGHQVYTAFEPAGLARRKHAATQFAKGRDQRVELEREPSNPQDPKAIRVIGCWRGWILSRRTPLGYVPRHVAKVIADLLLRNKSGSFGGNDGISEGSRLGFEASCLADTGLVFVLGEDGFVVGLAGGDEVVEDAGELMGGGGDGLGGPLAVSHTAVELAEDGVAAAEAIGSEA